MRSRVRTIPHKDCMNGLSTISGFSNTNRASNMDKYTKQQEKDRFIAFKKAEEKHVLTKISRFLATAWDITALMAKLAPGESLIISEDGSIYQGRVKTDKYRLLAEKLPKAHPTAFDDTGRFPMQTSSWVNCPSATFKNSWEVAMRQRLYSDVEYAPIYDLFLERLEVTDMADVTYHTIEAPNKLSYHEVHIKNFPLSVAVGKSGNFLYFRMNGGEPKWA